MAELAEAVVDGLAGDLACAPCGLERAVAEGEVGGEGARVRAAGAVGGAVGVAGAGQGLERGAVVEDVGDLVAVTAGDDDGVRAEAVERSGELLAVGAVVAGEARGPRGDWA